MATSPAHSTKPVGSTRRRRARKGDGELLRDEILEVAEELLIESGSKDAVTLRAVAERVGVSTPSIYLHFADKDLLFYEFCRRTFAKLNLTMMEAAATEGSVIERMARVGEAYIRFALAHPAQYKIVFGEDHHAMPEDQLQDDPGVQAFELLVGMLDAGIAEGSLIRVDDVRALAVAVWAAVHGAVMILMAKQHTEQLFPPSDEESVIKSVIDLMGRGVAANPG